MKNFLIGFLLFFQINVHSQDFEKVDQIVAAYPTFATQSDLINRINLDFKLPSEKARALFYWICNTISYDVDFYNRIESENIQAFSYKTEKEFQEKNKKFNEDLASKTFQTKKAVCDGYSALYKILANKLGLECELVRGDLKSDPEQIGNKPTTNHSWNAIKIDGQYKLIDCTLAAGTISSKTQSFVFDYNDVFFCTDPKLFLYNHFPDDAKWLLTNTTMAYYQGLPVFFADYLKDSTNIGLPKKGMLSDSEAFVIDVANFNMENGYVEYLFDNEKHRETIDFEASQSDYNLKISGYSGHKLFIFVNGKIYAAYLIK